MATRLAAARDRCPPDEPVLRRFLDCVLDKRDGRHRYESYLALPLLLDLLDGSAARLDARALTALLVADVLRFEVAALHGWHTLLPGGRPPLGTVQKRIRHGGRHIARNTGPADLAAVVDTLVAHVVDPNRAAELLQALPNIDDRTVARRLACTVHPVHTFHEEYVFIRVVQRNEIVFTELVTHARDAVGALRGGSVDHSLDTISKATDAFERSKSLFSLLATVSPDAFRMFRPFTEGSSAIQSEHYKRFEMLCGIPPTTRLSSAAFDDVPGVRTEALAGPDTITGAFLDGCRSGRWTDPDRRAVEAALSDLERVHQRWKSTHRTLAGRMIGDAPGSGYTTGVPYLQACLDNRLFWRLGDTVTDRREPVAQTHDGHPGRAHTTTP